MKITNTTWVILAQPVKQGVGFIVSVILARLLLPKDYGIVAAGQILTGFLGIFSGVGFYEAVVQKKELTSNESDIFFTLNITIGGLLFVVSCASAPLLALFFVSPELITIIPVMSLTFIFSSLGILHNSLLAREQRFKEMIALELSGQLGAGLVSVGMALYGFDYWSLVALNVLMVLIPSIGVWYLSGWRPKKLQVIGIGQMIKSVRFGMSVMTGNLINYGSAQIDRLLVGKYYQMTDLGLYTRSQQLALYSNNLFFIGPHRFVTARLSRLQFDISSYREEILRLLSIVLWGSVLINFLLGINSRSLVNLLFGAKWDGMYMIFFWLSLGNAAFAMAYAYTWLYTSLGKGRELIISNVIRLILTVIAIFVGLRWGVIGLSIAYSISVWIFSIITAHSTAYHTNGRMSVFLSALLRPTCFALIGSLPALYFYSVTDHSILSLINRSLILIVIYLALSYFFDRQILIKIRNLIIRREIVVSAL